MSKSQPNHGAYSAVPTEDPDSKAPSEFSIWLADLYKRNPFWLRALKYVRGRIFPGWDEDKNEGIVWFAARFGEASFGLLGGIAACASFWAGNFELGFPLLPIIILTAVGVTLTIGVEIQPWQEYVGKILAEWVKSWTAKGRAEQGLAYFDNRKEACQRADDNLSEAQERREHKATVEEEDDSEDRTLQNKIEAEKNRCVKKLSGYTARPTLEKEFEIALLKYRILTSPITFGGKAALEDSEWKNLTDKDKLKIADEAKRTKAELALNQKYTNRLEELGDNKNDDKEFSERSLQTELSDKQKEQVEAHRKEYELALDRLIANQEGYILQLQAEHNAVTANLAKARSALTWHDWSLEKVGQLPEQESRGDSDKLKAYYAAKLQSEAWDKLFEEERDYLALLKDTKDGELEKKRIQAHAAYLNSQQSFMKRSAVWWREFFQPKNLARSLMWLTVMVNSATVAMACAIWFIHFFENIAGFPVATCLGLAITLGACYWTGSVSFNKFLVDGVFRDTESAPPNFMVDPSYRQAYAKAKTLSTWMGIAAGVAFTILAVATFASLPWSAPILIGVGTVGCLCILVCQIMVAKGAIQSGFRRSLEIRYHQEQVAKQLRILELQQKKTSTNDPNVKLTPKEKSFLKTLAGMPKTIWTWLCKEPALWLQNFNRAFFTGAYITKTFFDWINKMGLDPTAGPLIMGLTILGYVGGLILAAVYLPYDRASYNGCLYESQTKAYLEAGKLEEANELQAKLVLDMDPRKPESQQKEVLEVKGIEPTAKQQRDAVYKRHAEQLYKEKKHFGGMGHFAFCSTGCSKTEKKRLVATAA